MSSGQRRRVPAEFPRMKYRGRARARHERMQCELVQRFLRLGGAGGSYQLGVLLGEAFKGFAAETMRAAGEVFGAFGGVLSDMADALDPPKRSDFTLMPLGAPLPVLEAGTLDMAGPSLEHGVIRIDSRKTSTGVWSSTSEELGAAWRAQGVEPYDFKSDRLGRFRLDGSDL